MKTNLLSRFGTFSLLVILSVCFTIHPATAAQKAYLGFEADVGTTFRKGDSCCKWLFDNHNDITFRMPLQPTSDKALQLAWISKTLAYQGTQSLGVRLNENPNKDERQRMEFQLANSLYFRPELEDSVYYGFALKIHPQSAPWLRKGVVLTQAWQVHNTASSKEAPFSIRFNDKDSYTWTVYTSTDVAGVDNRNTPGTKTAIYTSPTGLTMDEWHEFVIWFKPSVQKKGAVRVWLDGNLVVSQTNQKNFGYKPQTAEPFMTNRLEYRFGAYRVTGPLYPGDVILMYDQAKLGTSFADVDP